MTRLRGCWKSPFSRETVDRMTGKQLAAKVRHRFLHNPDLPMSALSRKRQSVAFAPEYGVTPLLHVTFFHFKTYPK